MAKSDNIDQQVEVAKQQFTRLANTITEAMAQEMEDWGREVVLFAAMSDAMPVDSGALRASGFAVINASGQNKQVLTIGFGGPSPKTGSLAVGDFTLTHNKNTPDGVVRYAGLQENKRGFLFGAVQAKLPDLPKKAKERFKKIVRTGKGGASKVSANTAPLRK